jgi:hypothetical protein
VDLVFFSGQLIEHDLPSPARLGGLFACKPRICRSGSAIVAANVPSRAASALYKVGLDGAVAVGLPTSLLPLVGPSDELLAKLRAVFAEVSPQRETETEEGYTVRITRLAAVQALRDQAMSTAVVVSGHLTNMRGLLHEESRLVLPHE